MTKEELKQEAKEYAKPWKNSLAYVSIKDAYLAGTEPREKQLQEKDKKIEELEQENTLLKGRNEGFEKQIMGLLIKYEEFYKRFPDLKSAMDKAAEVLKENAKLKERLKPENCLKSLAKSGFVKFTCENGNEHDQLIKATKLIRSLYNYCCSYGATGKATTEAEQFLSEVEE